MQINIWLFFFLSEDLFLTAQVRSAQVHATEVTCRVHTVQYSNSETDQQGETHILWLCRFVGMLDFIVCLVSLKSMLIASLNNGSCLSEILTLWCGKGKKARSIAT